MIRAVRPGSARACPVTPRTGAGLRSFIDAETTVPGTDVPARPVRGSEEDHAQIDDPGRQDGRYARSTDPGPPPGLPRPTRVRPWLRPPPWHRSPTRSNPFAPTR